MAIAKKEARVLFKSRREALSEQAYETLNNQVLDVFRTLSLEGINCLHTFLPIRSKREPDTFLLIDYLKIQWPAVRILVPRSDLLGYGMDHYVYEGKDYLIENRWNMLEPLDTGERVDEQAIDLVLIPLLAFDREGNRVGYGKGYYDRFLTRCRSDIQKVGVSLFDPVEAIDDVDPYDISLDACITPREIWRFH